MECPKCGFDNRTEDRYCIKCGEKLELVCPKCGALIHEGALFCGSCGRDLRKLAEGIKFPPTKEDVYAEQDAKIQSYVPRYLAEKILANKGALIGERKQITCLFADVVGFTPIAEALDPEQVRSIMNGCFEILINEVHCYEGTVNQFTGDGVMALFGAPIAHEDHAQRAIYAALAAQESLSEYGEELKRKMGISLKMRMGLNTGIVIVGSIGNNLRMDYTALGDTINVAARLQSLAEPGGVLVSEETFNIARGYFEFKPLSELQLKGKVEKVKACKVTGIGKVKARIEAAELRGLTKFCGRKRDLEQLLDAFESAERGEGQVVAIVGEPGIGKSRLVLEFRRSMEEENFYYLEGRCPAYGETKPYSSLVQILRTHFGIGEMERTEVCREKIQGKLCQDGNQLTPFLPFFLNLLSIPIQDEAFSKLELQEKRERTFEALKALLVWEAQKKPLVMVVEDMQSIDDSSDEFIRYLIEGIVNVPMLLLCIFRPEYQPRWPEHAYYRRLSLSQLSTEARLDMFYALLGEGAEELRDPVLQLTGGNPLFIEEVIHSLIDQGAVTRREEKLVLNKTLQEIQIPSSIEGLIASRIDRLETDLKEVLQLASVIGMEFAFQVLAVVSGMITDLKRYLLRLQTLEFIYEKSLFPEPAYSFKHAFTQEVAYNGLLVELRKEYHRQVAQAIERVYQERIDEHFEDLAYHYSRGEEVEKGIEYLKKAGDKAYSLYSNREASKHYEKALDILSGMPDSIIVKKKRLEIELSLETVLLALVENLERVEDVLSDMERIATSIGDQKWIAIAQSERAYFYTIRRRDEKAIEYAKGVWEKTEDVETLARSGLPLMLSNFFKGQLAEGKETCDKCLDALERSGRIHETFGFPVPPYVTFSTVLGYINGFQGDMGLSLKYHQRALEVAKEANNQPGIGFSTYALGWDYVMRGQYQEGIPMVREGTDILEPTKVMPYVVVAYAVLAQCYHIAGDWDLSMEYFTKCVYILGTTPGFSKFPVGPDYSYFADLLLDLGEIEAAKETCEEGLSVAKRDKNLWSEGEMHRAFGRIYAQSEPPDWKKAEAHLLQSIQCLEKLGMRLRCAVSWGELGEMYQRKGDREKAEACLEKSNRMYQEMGIKPLKAKRPGQATIDRALAIMRGEEVKPIAPVLMTLADLMQLMPMGFRAENAKGIDAIIQLNFTGKEEGSWYLTIRNQGCTCESGVVENPALTLTCSSDVWLAIAQKKMSPLKAFVTGKLKVKGNIKLLFKMRNLF